MRALRLLCGLVVVVTLMTGTAAAQQGSSREDPVPMGESAQVGNYSVRVTTFDPDATERILDASNTNVPPLDGSVYIVVRIDVTYTGNDAGYAFAVLWSYTGSGDTELAETDCTAYGDVLDDEGETLDLFPDGMTSYEMCAQVPTDERDDLLLYGQTVGSDLVFFALDPNYVDTATPTASPEP